MEPTPQQPAQPQRQAPAVPPSHLKPERLELDPAATDSDRKFKHWMRTFTNYSNFIQDDAGKLNALVNLVGHEAFELIENDETYEAAIQTLKTAYQKTVNVIYARHVLTSRKQNADESLDDYLRSLRLLAKNCQFQNVSAQEYHDECIMYTFISGLRSPQIRARLLENATLNLKTAFDTARSLEIAQKNAETYAIPNPTCSAVKPAPNHRNRPPEDQEYLMAMNKSNNPPNRYSNQNSNPPNRFSNQNSNEKCYFCNYDRHPRNRCPARDVTCSKCSRRGHFTRCCKRYPNSSQVLAAAPISSNEQATPNDPTSSSEFDTEFQSATLWAICSSIPKNSSNHPLSQSMLNVEVNNHPVTCIADSASSASFIHPQCAEKLKLILKPIDQKYEVGMASNSLKVSSTSYALVNLKVKDRIYENMKLYVLPNLCTNLILGLDFLAQHKCVTLNFTGDQPPLSICGFSKLKTEPKSLFSNLPPNCEPIRDSRRRYSKEDEEFISLEVQRMLKEGIIEQSKSPWRAQIVVVKKNGKRRLTVDYSQTINIYTKVDAYPLPLIPDLVNKIAQFSVYSTVDLTAAYHQLELQPQDRHFTAFEANGRLFQFCRLPFGVTNGVSVFQREMDRLVDVYNLKGTFPYLDNITICGKDQKDHDTNLSNFLAAAKKVNLKYNESKCEFNTRKLKLLGCLIENGEIRPDPDRMRPLENLPPPHNQKSLKRCLGFFSHYAKWIPNFSEEVRPLSKTTTFPISDEALKSIESMKQDIKSSVVCCIDDSIPFQVECDASDHTLAATLNQQGRPVAFFSRTLSPHEIIYPSVEKEALSVIEAVRHWRYLLATQKFTLITDQRSVSFMFNTNTKSKKIKNDKLLRWRMELSTYNYEIIHRPGRLNESPDALSRVCAVSTGPDLKQIHNDLCHPGITRMLHFVKSRNLPFSVEEVRTIVRTCPICLECKPRFYKPDTSPLIKATKPMERLNVDYKGPLPSYNKNIYFLNVVDEYSRFIWIFPCSNMDSSTVCRCLMEIFTFCGLPNYIHSDRGPSFLSSEVKNFLISKGVASSRTTAYNPTGNGQVEKANLTIWKSITLSLKSKGLPTSRWQDVVPEVLHSTRSLLCTSTNETPHERFFNFPRKASAGTSLPHWLLEPGPVYLKKHVRERKTDPLVETVELLQANPQYAYVRYQDGRETTVSLKHLAPAPRLESPTTSADSLFDPSAHKEIQPAPTLQESEPNSANTVEEIPIAPVNEDSPTKREPVMGRSGERWCEINPANILSDSRRRKDTNSTRGE